MEKHFKLLENDSIIVNGHVLYRIQAIADFNLAKKDDLGGYVETLDNLSCNAWVFDNAKVFGNAEVSDNAEVSGNARVFDNAKVSGNARVFDNAEVFGNAEVSGNAGVFGNARAFNSVMVFDDAEVFGNAKVSGNAEVFGNAKVYDNAKIYIVANIGSANRTTTFFTDVNDKIIVRCGCFTGTIKEFKKAVVRTHKGNKHEAEYLYAIKVAEAKMLSKKLNFIERLFLS